MGDVSQAGYLWTAPGCSSGIEVCFLCVTCDCIHAGFDDLDLASKPKGC